MKSVTRWTLLLFTAILCPTLSAQQKIITTEQYQASVRTARNLGEQWRTLLSSVNIDDLPVMYATGKTYQAEKSGVAGSLEMFQLWGDRVAKSDSLFDEINYLSELQELQSQLQLLNDLVEDFDVRDTALTAKVRAWGVALNSVATGPLQDAYMTAYLYTTQHALRVEQSCAK